MPGQGLVDSTACVSFVGAVLGKILVLFTRLQRPRTGTRNLRNRGHNEAKAKRRIYIQRLLTKYSNTYGAY